MAKARRRQREKRERRYSSAKHRVETHKTGFESTSIKAGKDVDFFNLKREGTKRLDILPYTVGEGNPFADPGELHYERTFFIHRDIGVEANARYICLAKTMKKPCPVCEYRAKLAANPDADGDLVKSLLPKERQLWNVIDLAEPDKGVQLWDISFHLFGSLLDEEIRNADEDEDFGNFFHLEDGHTLKLGIVEKVIGKGRPFHEVRTIGFKTRRTAIGDDVFEQTRCLDDLLDVYSYEKLKAVLFQTAEVEDGGSPETDEDNHDLDGGDATDEDYAESQQEDEKPKPRKKRAKSKSKATEPPKRAKGDLVEYHGEECTVTRVSKDGTSLDLEGEEGDTYRPVGEDEVTPVETEPKPKPKAKAKPKTKSKPKPPKKEEEESDSGDDDLDDDEENWDEEKWDEDTEHHYEDEEDED